MAQPGARYVRPNSAHLIRDKSNATLCEFAQSGVRCDFFGYHTTIQRKIAHFTKVID